MMQACFGLPRFRVVKDKLTGLYKCHLCSYKSIYGSSLRSHFAVHSNARPYGCDMCNYEAKRLPDLKKHKILKHIRKKHCNTSTFVNKNPLQVFRDPRSGLYRCQHCSYQSDSSRCVRSHLAVHSQLRPYACDTCSYEAKRSSDLNKHKIIKHGRIPIRRNKSHKPPVVKADTTFTGSSDITSSQRAANFATACSTANGESGHGPVELDHCDVLSDLDYSLMSPTRAALEALRRCNMTEPLDMLSEYNSHEALQQSVMFCKHETHVNKKQSQPTQLQSMEQNQFPYQSYGVLAPFSQGQPPNQNDSTVFIKPEPPDDYFEHLRCGNNQTVENTGCSEKVSLMEGEVSTTVLLSSQKSSHKMVTVQSHGFPGGTDAATVASSEPGETAEQVSTSLEQPRAEQTGEVESHGGEKVLAQLQRHASCASPARPTLPNPRPLPCVDHISAECTASHGSGYSSPSASTPASQCMALKHEMESDGSNDKMTNTRKSWSCQHCDIVFFDGALYFMHMGLHNGDDPWRCNMCCTKFYDVYGFTSHFVNGH